VKFKAISEFYYGLVWFKGLAFFELSLQKLGFGAAKFPTSSHFRE
jgi:hypothetical protein